MYPTGFFPKNFFRQKYTKQMFLGSVFDGDHQSTNSFIKMYKNICEKYRQYMIIDAVVEHILQLI